MRIFAVDPGTEQSAAVGWDGRRVIQHSVMANTALLQYCRGPVLLPMVLVLERIESFGMPVGKETFQTVFWCGRFAEAWEQAGGSFAELSRKAVKVHICGSMKATDATIRRALIDRIGPIGTKAHKGPLYGMNSHEFQALAVAVTYADTYLDHHQEPLPTALLPREEL